MPVFRYKAVSGEGGEILQGVIEADSREAAIARLQGAGHLPLVTQAVFALSALFRATTGGAWGSSWSWAGLSRSSSSPCCWLCTA